MKIGRALPFLFTRSYPVLEPDHYPLFAVSLLRFRQIDALRIHSRSGEKKKCAVFGYSFLSKLLETNPSRYEQLLKSSCEMVATEIPLVSSNDEIEKLLDIMQKARIGFAWVEDANHEKGGLVSLRDLLLLYEKKIFSARLSVENVASPIFAVDRTTTIRQALDDMFSRRIRRLFITGTNSFVSDREITSYIFSPSQLIKIAVYPDTLLDGTLYDIESRPAKEIDPKAGIDDAALVMTNYGEDCLVSKKGIVTAWDLVMKPWIARDMRIN